MFGVFRPQKMLIEPSAVNHLQLIQCGKETEISDVNVRSYGFL